MAFIREEIDFIRSQHLARLATVSSDGQPDVVPVAFEFDGVGFWIGGSGQGVLATRKFRNVAEGCRKVALVIDELVSLDPFIARSVRVYGEAEDPVEREGMVGPGFYVRIAPTISWSWNMAGEPVGDNWYEARRAEHDGASR
jgi:pyridoxamine 5'-phosphate oxidase family protein